jgi:hypothetical protein
MVQISLDQNNIGILLSQLLCRWRLSVASYGQDLIRGIFPKKVLYQGASLFASGACDQYTGHCAVCESDEVVVGK